MYSRIQVALDGSHFSEQALPVAEMLARRFEADLDLVTVHEPTAGIDVESWDRSVSDWSEEYIQAISDTVAERSGRPTTGYFRVGSASRALIDHAERAGCDLVIAATHGRGAFSRAWLGSVAYDLIRRSDRPVLLIHPDEDQAADAQPAQATPFRKILVPLDGTEFSARVLEDAASLAKAFDAGVILVRVIPFPMEIASPYLPTTVQMNREVVEDAKAAAKSWLADRAKTLSAQGIAVEVRTPVASQPAREISEVAAETEADLIVMATHGRSGLGRAVLGSTTDKVVRSTHIPVLTRRLVEEEG